MQNLHPPLLGQFAFSENIRHMPCYSRMRLSSQLPCILCILWFELLYDPHPQGMQPNTSPLRRSPCSCASCHKSNETSGISTSIRRLRIRLFQDFADEGEYEEGEDSAPDKGVENHQHPPEDSAGGGTDRVCDGIPRLTEELCPFENQETDEVDDTQRNVRKQKRFHFFHPFL